MTVPVVSHIHVMDGGVTFQKDVQTAFFLPAQFQSDPPRPADPEITIVHREPIRVVARSEPRHLAEPPEPSEPHDITGTHTPLSRPRQLTLEADGLLKPERRCPRRLTPSNSELLI